MSRRRSTSSSSESKLPNTVSESLTAAVNTLTARLLSSVPLPDLTRAQIDDLLSDPEDNAFLRRILQKAPHRVSGHSGVTLCLLDDTPEHAEWRERRRGEKLPSPPGTYNLSFTGHGVISGVGTTGNRGLLFVHTRRDPLASLIPRYNVTPEQLEQLASLRAYAVERHKVGLHVAAARAFTRETVKLCTTVPQLLRVWPNSLRWAGEALRDYHSRFGSKRGRQPPGWTPVLTKAVAGVDFVLGKASLLPAREWQTGDWHTRSNRIYPPGGKPRLPWNNQEFDPD